MLNRSGRCWSARANCLASVPVLVPYSTSICPQRQKRVIISLQAFESVDRAGMRMGCSLRAHHHTC